MNRCAPHELIERGKDITPIRECPAEICCSLLYSLLVSRLSAEYLKKALLGY